MDLMAQRDPPLSVVIIHPFRGSGQKKTPTPKKSTVRGFQGSSLTFTPRKQQNTEFRGIDKGLIQRRGSGLVWFQIKDH